MTDQNTNSTDATLQYSHPENLEKWPGLPEKNVSFEYRLRRLGSQHFGVHFFPKGSQDSDRLGSNNTIEDGIIRVGTTREAFFFDQSFMKLHFWHLLAGILIRILVEFCDYLPFLTILMTSKYVNI